MTTPTVPPAVADHLVAEAAARHAHPLRRTLEVADRFVASLAAAGYDPAAVTTFRGSLNVHMGPVDPFSVARDVGVQVREAHHYPESAEPFTTVRGIFDITQVTIFGAYAPEDHVVVDTDTGEELTGPAARSEAVRVAAATTGRRVHVEAVTR